MFLVLINNTFNMSAQNQHDNYLVNSLTQVCTVCKEKTEYGTEKYVQRRKGDIIIERIFN